MSLLQHFFCLVASILLATKVFSSPQDSANSGGNAGNPYLVLNLESDSADLTNPPAQRSSIEVQPNFNTPPVQGPDPSNNRITNINSIDLQAGNLWPNRLTSGSASAGADNNTPLHNSQNSALLFDDDTGSGAVTDVLRSFPAPLIDFFPNGLPEFDPYGVIRWFNRPTKPKCDKGKFAFCCQLGPAQLQQRKSVAPPTAEQRAERAQRLRKCRNWSVDDPACYFPENEACCDCKSEQQTAFFCYFPRWRDDKKFQGKPQRPPLQLPNPDKVVDPNPSEPYPSPNQKKKRDWNVLDDDDDDSNNNGDLDNLYASKPPTTEPYRHPGGRNRLDSTCTDAYLEILGVRIQRYRAPAIHSPETPFEAIPKLPKGQDGRRRINKPNPRPLPIRKPKPPSEEW